MYDNRILLREDRHRGDNRLRGQSRYSRRYVHLGRRNPGRRPCWSEIRPARRLSLRD